MSKVHGNNNKFANISKNTSGMSQVNLT